MKKDKLTYKERKQLFKDCPQERSKVFEKLLDHIRAGYSLDCFSEYSEPEIREIVKEYKEEWIQEELLEAMRKGKQGWEDIGRRQSTGDCLGNSRSWYYNMSNRFGWRDKVDIEAEMKGHVSVNIITYNKPTPLIDMCES